MKGKAMISYTLEIGGRELAKGRARDMIKKGGKNEVERLGGKKESCLFWGLSIAEKSS